MFAPLIHAARADSTNATTSATSSAEPEATPREFASLELGKPLRVATSEAVPAAPREHDRARTDRVDTNSIGGQLPGQRTSQENFARLGRAILRVGPRLPARDRRDRHGTATAAFPHMWHRGTDRSHGVKQVQIEVRSQSSDVDSSRPLTGRSADIRDQQVDSAKSAAASSTKRSTSPAAVTSAAMPCARPPAARSSPSAASSVSTVRAQNATCAPSATRRRAIARPIPRLPPVTSAILPLSPRSNVCV